VGKWELVSVSEVTNILDNKRVPITASERRSGKYPYYGANGVQDYIDNFIFDDELVLLAEDGGNFGSATRPIAYRVSGKCWVNNHAHVLKPKENLDVDYLCYSIMFYDVLPLISGTTRAKLNKSALSKMLIPLPPLDIQKRIAAALDTANALIEKRKEQIEKLDLLIKSQFIEMFGDPVTNPKGWEKKHLEEIANVGSSRRVFVEELVNEGVPFYRGTEIGAMGTGESITPSLFITSQHYDRLKAVTGVPVIGDLLMPSICPDGRIWRVNTIDPFYFKDGRVLWVHFTEKSFDNTYLLYALKERIIAEYMNIASGTTFAELKIFSLKRVSVLLPPLVFQTQFAEFVQKVEAQKALLQKSLADMEQNYQSLLQKCFKGEIF
jgi:type I restriction enzyme S subunit